MLIPLVIRPDIVRVAKIAGAVLLGTWLVLWLMGGAIDRLCVEGQLSQAQAAAINNLEWEKCPKYRQGECLAEAGDRVINKQCSKFSKTVTLR